MSDDKGVEMEFDWWSLGNEALKPLAGAGSLWAISYANDVRKRISFHVDYWSVWLRKAGTYMTHSPETGTVDVRPLEFQGQVKWFSRKKLPVGLHDFSVEFSKGSWIKRVAMVKTPTEQSHDIVLRPFDWVALKFGGFVETPEDKKKLLLCDNVWLTARFAEKRIRVRWKLARINVEHITKELQKGIA